MGGRPHIYKGHSLWILKFKNIDQREEVRMARYGLYGDVSLIQAALLNGSQLMISSDEREELPQDEYYIQQLIGLDVIQQVSTWTVVSYTCVSLSLSWSRMKGT